MDWCLFCMMHGLILNLQFKSLVIRPNSRLPVHSRIGYGMSIRSTAKTHLRRLRISALDSLFWLNRRLWDYPTLRQIFESRASFRSNFATVLTVKSGSHNVMLALLGVVFPGKSDVLIVAVGCWRYHFNLCELCRPMARGIRLRKGMWTL